MIKYILCRLRQALIVLWLAFTLSFILLQAMPGDAALLKFLNPEYGLDGQQINDLRTRYGFNEPILYQYVKAINNFAHGDLGFSMQAGVPVKDQLAANLPPTLRLAGTAFLLAVAIAFAVTLFCVFVPFFKNFILSLPSLFISLPLFWIGIMFINLFSFQLGWVSIISPGPIAGMILPVVALAIPISAPLAQILMRSVADFETRPLVSVLKAKGASKWRIFGWHSLRNAALPALTIAGLLFGELISGAVVTETVFGLNGIGKLTEQAVQSRDLSVLQAIVVISALTYVTINFLIDLISPLIDPRLATTKGQLYVRAQ